MAPFFVHEDFILYLTSEKRFSEHTCKAYRKDLDQFVEFSGIQKESEWREVSSKLVRAWMVDLIEKGYVSTSVNRKLSSLRTYFRWMRSEGIVETNPMKLVFGPKKEKRLPSFAQQKDLRPEKLDLFFDDDFEGVRDKLMFELFYQTGIRLSELIELKDTDVSSERIKVLGKRNKERLIPISNELYRLIEQYRLKRSEIQNVSEKLLVLRNGKKLYQKLVYRKINSYLGKATDMEKKSPHVLRHTFATHMLNNGAGLEVLKELLGHANLSATQVYTHNSFAELTSIYSQSHPRGRQK